MPRPLEREKPLQRVNVMLDCDALEKAQRKAAKAGVAPAIAGSTSAFIRWLIDQYNERIEQIRDDEARMKLRSIPKLSINMAKFCAESERTMLEEFGLDKLKIPTFQKASHKGERDDAIQAARIGMKMADGILNKKTSDRKNAHVLRSDPADAVEKI